MHFLPGTCWKLNCFSASQHSCWAFRAVIVLSCNSGTGSLWFVPLHFFFKPSFYLASDFPSLSVHISPLMAPSFSDTSIRFHMSLCGRQLFNDGWYFEKFTSSYWSQRWILNGCLGCDLIPHWRVQIFYKRTQGVKMDWEGYCAISIFLPGDLSIGLEKIETGEVRQVLQGRLGGPLNLFGLGSIVLVQFTWSATVCPCFDVFETLHVEKAFVYSEQAQ